MKNLYKAIINVLIFFFVTDLFEVILKVGNNSFYERLVYAIIFAGLMYLAPHVLLFLKISVTEVMEFLIEGIISFLFFFLGYYIFDFVEISSTVFDSKIPVLQPINFIDKSIALLVIGMVVAAMSAGLRSMNKKKKKLSSSSYS